MQLTNEELENMINSVRTEVRELQDGRAAEPPTESTEQATAKLRMVALIDQIGGVLNGATDRDSHRERMMRSRPPIRLTAQDTDHLLQLLDEMKEQMGALHGVPIWYRYHRAEYRDRTYTQSDLRGLRNMHSYLSEENIRSLTGDA